MENTQTQIDPNAYIQALDEQRTAASNDGAFWRARCLTLEAELAAVLEKKAPKKERKPRAKPETAAKPELKAA